MENKRRVYKMRDCSPDARLLLPGGDGCLAPFLTLSHGHRLPTLPLKAGVRHVNSHGNLGKYQSRIETLELKNCCKFSCSLIRRVYIDCLEMAEHAKPLALLSQLITYLGTYLASHRAAASQQNMSSKPRTKAQKY